MPTLLLLNCSNYPRRPIYPYAFVQLAALGRKYGVKVVCHDFLGEPRARWPARVRALVAEHRPQLVGLHVRQGDDMELINYTLDPDWFSPFRDVKHVVDLVRAETDVPVAVGGVGLTVHIDRAFDALAPDYAMVGCGDPLFQHFDDLCARRALDTVPNLRYRDDEGVVRTNARVLYPPLDRPEYTPEQIDELQAFYASRGVTSWDAGVAPVEVSRGCPYRCYFCAEPHGKGNRSRFRSLDVVFEDVALLVSRGFRRIWCICSELNTQGATLAMELAARFLAFNRGRPEGDRVEWIAYALPRFTRDEMAALQASGFSWHFNEAQSLDDENLKLTRVPYRSSQVLQTLKDAAAVGFTSVGSRLSLFIGNAFSTPATLYRTLERLEREGLLRHFRGGGMVPAPRIYPFMVPLLGEAPNDISFAPDDAPEAQRLLWPTFRVPEALQPYFDDIVDYLAFIRFYDRHFFQAAYTHGQRWTEFWRSSATPTRLFRAVRALERPSNAAPALARLLEARSAERLVAALTPSRSKADEVEAAARALADVFIEGQADALPAYTAERSPLEVLRRLPKAASSAVLAERFARRRGVPAHHPSSLAFGAWLYRENVEQALRYRRVLIPKETSRG